MSRELIEAAFAGDVDLQEAAPEVEAAIAQLDQGTQRVAEQVDGEWKVNGWLMKAILLYFRLRKSETIDIGPFEYHDKIPLKRNLASQEVRVVPPGMVRSLRALVVMRCA